MRADEEKTTRAGGPTAFAARLRCLRLWASVQADGFRFDPFGYLQGLGWRARGLKVRARHRLSALTGRSAHAYDFWVSCREPQSKPMKILVGTPEDILIVIDCRTSREGLERTLRSVQGARSVTIGDTSELSDALKGAGWICAIPCGDVLADGALAAYAAVIATHPEARIIYGDDDLLSRDGRRQAPHFKPSWNPELFANHDFLTGACIFRQGSASLAGAVLHDWPRRSVQELIETGPKPVHLPIVLHHRATRPQPSVPGRPADLDRLPKPSVTAIIPTRNQLELLRTCLDGLRGTNYPHVDVIVVDNGSDDPSTLAYLTEVEAADVRVLRSPGPFNYSALNNRAVAEARGEVLLFLNNDVEIIDDDWLGLLVMHVTAADIGAVGAQLLYPDGTIQHAGVYTGLGGGAGHAHRYLPAEAEGYFHRASLPQRVSAVTGACLAVERHKFIAVGGFDEERFPVAFNDVDLCLKLNAAGWQSFYEPRARLIHHESKSRGSDRLRANRGRFAGELAALKEKWLTDVEVDPFHHPHLSPFCEEFFVAI